MEKLITQVVEEHFHNRKKDIFVVFYAMTLYQNTSQGEWWDLQKKQNQESLEANRGETRGEERKGLGRVILVWDIHPLSPIYSV